MLTLQSSKSQSVYLLIFKVNQDNLADVNVLASQGVSFTKVQEGLRSLLRLLRLLKIMSTLLGFCPRYYIQML